MADAVLLDVGGVLLLPDPEVLGPALDAANVSYDATALAMAHYGGVRALDADPSDWPVATAPGSYLDGFLAGAGVAEVDRDRATQALHPVFSRPSIDVWRRTTPLAREALSLLDRSGRPVAVISNADGTVERQLVLHALAQVGPGPGLEVAAIVDSAVVGVSKPDPAVFAPALDVLGLAPHRCAYIGDTVTYDVVGARAAGLVPIHLDPWRACRRDDHEHAADVRAAVQLALDGHPPDA